MPLELRETAEVITYNNIEVLYYTQEKKISSQGMFLKSRVRVRGIRFVS